ncbi:hypothetical protein niasHT_009080 [Heterodera trifolii]|uniref:Uncharacterized protein n=1 Tax=Heterodera trifolii TaxID=157864 RepID=A0ABD2MAI9_9BILA
MMMMSSISTHTDNLGQSHRQMAMTHRQGHHGTATAHSAMVKKCSASQAGLISVNSDWEEMEKNITKVDRMGRGEGGGGNLAQQKGKRGIWPNSAKVEAKKAIWKGKRGQKPTVLVTTAGKVSNRILRCQSWRGRDG